MNACVAHPRLAAPGPPLRGAASSVPSRWLRDCSVPLCLCGQKENTEFSAMKFLAAVVFVVAAVSIAVMQVAAPDEETVWVCPMHTDYTMDLAGKCPRCGMDLVRAAAFDVRDYSLDFQTV